MVLVQPTDQAPKPTEMLTENLTFKLAGGFIFGMAVLAILAWGYGKYRKSKEDKDTDAPRIAPVANAFGANYDPYFWDDEGGEMPFLEHESSLEVRRSWLEPFLKSFCCCTRRGCSPGLTKGWFKWFSLCFDVQVYGWFERAIFSGFLKRRLWRCLVGTVLTLGIVPDLAYLALIRFWKTRLAFMYLVLITNFYILHYLFSVPDTRYQLGERQATRQCVDGCGLISSQALSRRASLMVAAVTICGLGWLLWYDSWRIVEDAYNIYVCAVVGWPTITFVSDVSW